MSLNTTHSWAKTILADVLGGDGVPFDFYMRTTLDMLEEGLTVPYSAGSTASQSASTAQRAHSTRHDATPSAAGSSLDGTSNPNESTISSVGLRERMHHDSWLVSGSQDKEFVLSALEELALTDSRATAAISQIKRLSQLRAQYPEIRMEESRGPEVEEEDTDEEEETDNGADGGHHKSSSSSATATATAAPDRSSRGQSTRSRLENAYTYTYGTVYAGSEVIDLYT